MSNTCAVCDKAASLKCSACKSIFYCSKEHQTVHWKKHKGDCRRIAQVNATVIPRGGKCYLFQLPHDVIIFMLDFLKSEKFQGKKIYELSYDTRFFLNSNKKCYGDYKREIQLIRMGRIKSTEFMASAAFRERVLKTILDPRQQLSLTLVRPEVIQRLDRNFYDLSNLSRIHSISLSDCSIKKFSPLEEVEHLSLDNCMTTDLTPFANVKRLHYLSRQRDATTDLSCLENVEEVMISCGKISHYENLKNAKKLEFIGVTELYDVSCFAEAYSVRFFYCPNITSLHRLGNLHSLSINDCPLTDEDVTMFGNIHSLTITKCLTISNISKLHNVHELTLDGCPHILDLSGLDSIEKFSFKSFQGISLHGLETAKIVDISSSNNIIDLSPLSNVEELNIMHCRQIIDISMLQKVRKLNISFCSQINSFIGLNNVEELIMKSNSPQQFTIQHGMEIFPRLKLFTFGEITNFSELMDCFLKHQEQISLIRKQQSYQLPFPAHHSSSSIPKMSFYYCSFNYHAGLSQILSLTFYDVKDLQEIPFFPYLRHLEINNCRSFRKLSGLPCLNTLSINSCPSLRSLAIIDPGMNPYYPNDPKKKFPIYEIFVFDCENLREIQVGRQIAYFQINECSKLAVIKGSRFINHLWADVLEEGIDSDECPLRLA
jgi:hypothetical protein